MPTPQILFIPLGKLRYSPFRRIETYPIRRAKVEALKESVRTIGLLPRLIARPISDDYELAYGAHLLTALRELFPPHHKIPVQIQEITDTQMLQAMSRENLEQWGSDPLVELETVVAVLEAQEKGLINLQIVKSTKKPNVITVGQFLGWIQPNGQVYPKLYKHLDAIDLMARGLLKRQDIEGLNTNQFIELIREISSREAAQERMAREAEEAAKKAQRLAKEANDPARRDAAERRQRTEEARAREYREHSKKETKLIVEQIGPQLREHKIGAKQVREKASELVPPPFMKQRMPDLGPGAQALARQLDTMLGINDDRRNKILEIIDWRDQLPRLHKTLLLDALRQLAERATKLATALDQPLTRGNGHPSKSAGPKSLK